jgi:hypothetical protein
MNIVFFGAHTATTYFVLVFWLGSATLALAAYWSIIKKSGFSPSWVLLPAAYFLLSISLVALLFFTTAPYSIGSASYSGPATLDSYKALAYLDIALGIANVIGFFIFAFATWPIEREIWRLNQRVREVSGQAVLLGAASHPAPSPASRVANAGATTVGTTLLAPAPAAPEEAEVTTYYCSWCGKERRSDAFGIHHCGSRSRAPVFCCTCGTTLTDGATFCGRCGTPTSTLSPQ